MLDSYSNAMATLYQSYRPPLHELLLKRVLKNQKFKKILDIGCGTGISSVALTSYGSEVYGYDPSPSMILKAQEHSNTTCVHQLEKLPSQFDLVVFFGSLTYVDDVDFDRYQRYVKPKGYLLCCDFQVDYQPVISKLSIIQDTTSYDHAKNLASYEVHSYQTISNDQYEVEFECSIDQLSHLLLSETTIQKSIQEVYDDPQTSKHLRFALNTYFPEKQVKLIATLYYSYYIKVDEQH